MIKIDAASPRRLSIVCMASILIFTLLLGNVAWGAQQSNWQPAVNLSDWPGRSMMHATVQHPLTGDLFVAWTESGVAQWEEIMIRRRDAASGEWLPAENLSSSESWAHDGGPALLVGPSGEVIAVWTRTYSRSQGAPADGHEVLSRAWDGTAWSPEQIVVRGESYLPGSPGTFYLVPAVTPDAVILFVAWDNGHRRTVFDNGAWQPPASWVYLDVSLDTVISDEAGHLHAGAFGENSLVLPPNNLFRDAYYLQSDTGEVWSEPVNLSSVTGVANSLDLAFDAQGRLHFLWSDPDYRDSLESQQSAVWELVYDGSQWGPNVEISSADEDQAINGLSLEAGDDGTLHLGWSEGLISRTLTATLHLDLDIYYRQGDGQSWGEVEKVYTSTAQSRYPLIALDSGHPYLLWQEIDTTSVSQEIDTTSVSNSDVYYSHLGAPAPRFEYYVPIVHR